MQQKLYSIQHAVSKHQSRILAVLNLVKRCSFVEGFAMTYADTTAAPSQRKVPGTHEARVSLIQDIQAQTGELGEIRNYFEGKIGLDSARATCSRD